MAKDKTSLIIVESPTKARTIGRIMGSDYNVVSSMGHILDLPKQKIGVDIENGFVPQYTTLTGRKKLLTELKKQAKGSNTIYVATDPDREGEAIGWHIKQKLEVNGNVQRVVFHEITPAAVKNAFLHPRDFDMNMIEAQTSRRVLDRIVGYYLSPLLWKKITRGLSAGRVQSVALRLIIEREKQIKSFKPQEYWEIKALLEKKAAGGYHPFEAKLEKINGEKFEVNDGKTAGDICGLLEKSNFSVTAVKNSERRRNPEPPFITSTLQQEAFNKLRFNSAKTMLVAQQLYEGIDIGQEAPVGLITYMRTDSPVVSKEAIEQARGHIMEKFGKDYLPETPNVYKGKKFAQQAHEAIRPSSLERDPESIKNFLTPEQYRLYKLIYERFLASQMMPSRYVVTSVEIKAAGADNRDYIFTASGSRTVFDGFMRVYSKIQEEEPEESAQQEDKKLPPLEQNEQLNLLKLLPSQHFTKAPPRYSDSSLVKALEELGIGRPSTYAPIITTLIMRNYVRRLKGYLYPTELGFKVCDFLVASFPDIMDVSFTARMEEELDEIEEGKLDRVKVLGEFYGPFKERVDVAQQNTQKEVILAEDICDKCGKPMMYKWGRKGKFLSCSGFPECKNSKSITSGVKCPNPGCGGELLERHSRRGFFYGCSNYPKCTFTSRTLPKEGQEEEKSEQAD